MPPSRPPRHNGSTSRRTPAGAPERLRDPDDPGDEYADYEDADPVGHLPADGASSPTCAVLLGIALVVALVVGLGAWYFGVARYTITPAVINLKQSAAESKIEKAGLNFTVDRTTYSEQIAPAR